MHLQSRTSRILCTVLSIMSLSACNDRTATTAPTDPTSPVATTAVQLATPGDSIAYALASALGDASLRSQMLQALRASPVNEHKLVLQDFASTYTGRTVLSPAAEKLRLNLDQIQRLVSRLPRLDLYLPFKQHRLTWEATPDIIVAVVFDPDTPAIDAFGVDGTVTTLRQSDGVPTRPLLIMHPEEPKLPRDNPQADMPGKVVQDANDGMIASAHFGPADGRDDLTAWLRSNRLARSQQNSGAQTTVVSGVYINHFNIQEGDGWFGNSEMQFHSFSTIGPISAWVGDYNQFPVFQASCPYGSYYQNDVEEDRGYDGLRSLSPGVTDVGIVPCDNSLGWYAVRIIEIDGGLNGGDDEFGWRFWYPGGYPFGATLGTATANVQSFFTNTWDNVRSAYFRIQYN